MLLSETSFQCRLAKDVKPPTPLQALKVALALLMSKNILFLVPHFFNVGANVCFNSGVIGSAIGFSLTFEYDKIIKYFLAILNFPFPEIQEVWPA